MPTEQNWKWIRTFLTDTSGLTTAEWSVLVALIALACLAGAQFMGKSGVQSTYNKASMPFGGDSRYGTR